MRGREFKELPKELQYPRDSLAGEYADNSLEVYEKVLGFKRSELENKMILDLGTGQTDRLARELKEAGVYAEVVGISPDLLTSSEKNKLQDLFPNWERQAIVGIAQCLPFQECSFDMVLGLYSVTYCSWYPEQVRAWISEIGRVLKPRGEARLGPVYRDPPAENAFGLNYEILLKAARSKRLKAEINKSYILLRK